jgi:hypothetical protein
VEAVADGGGTEIERRSERRQRDEIAERELARREQRPHLAPDLACAHVGTESGPDAIGRRV